MKSDAVRKSEQIRKDARTRYGAGWAYLSRDQRKNFEASRVLDLIIAQDGEQYAAAQRLIISVRRAGKWRTVTTTVTTHPATCHSQAFLTTICQWFLTVEPRQMVGAIGLEPTTPTMSR